MSAMTKASCLIAHRITITVILLLGLTQPLWAVQKLYKWIDSEGTVRYSDVLPAAAVRKKRDILNDQGYTVEKIERAKTAEELSRESKRQAIEAAQRRHAKAQAKRDKELLRTYHSEKDILRSRDAKINAIQYNITLEKDSINTHTENIATLRKSIAEYERAGRPIPIRLKNKVSDSRLMIMRINEVIVRKQLKRNNTQERYNNILSRYRLLETIINRK